MCGEETGMRGRRGRPVRRGVKDRKSLDSSISYFGMFLRTVAKWRPPFEEKRGLALFYEGAQAGANLARVYALLTQFLSFRERTREELSHHKGIWNS